MLKSVPTPFHLEAGPIWCYEVFNSRMYVMARPELIELGAPKMEGQCHISLKNLLKYSMILFRELDPLDYVEI
jgi:hypothetical protein